MAGQYGTSETCDLAELAVKILEGIKKAKEDGTFSWFDAASFVPAIIALFPAIDKINLVPKELGELDEEDQAIVKAKVLSLVPEAGEGWMAFAQKAIMAVFVNYELVQLYLEMKKAPATQP